MPDATILESVNAKPFPPESTLIHLAEAWTDPLGDTHDYVVVTRISSEYGPGAEATYIHPCDLVMAIDPETGEDTDTIDKAIPTPGSMMPLARFDYGSVRQAITQLGFTPRYEDEES